MALEKTTYIVIEILKLASLILFVYKVKHENLSAHVKQHYQHHDTIA